MSRLNAVERDTLPEDQRRFYDAVKAIRRRPVSGPFIVLMNSSPDLAARFAHLGHYFHSRGQADESILSMRVRGFASLIGSRALDAPYEWAAWVNWTLEAGVPQDTVDAIRNNKTPIDLTAEEALIADFLMQLISGNHHVKNTTFKAALDHFGTQGLVELVVTLGYFTMIALPLNAFEIEMTSEQKSLRKPFTPLIVNGTPWKLSDARRENLPSISGGGAASVRVSHLGTHNDVAPEHQHFLDRIVRTRGWLSGIFQVLLHSPDVAERMANIGAFFLYETILPPVVKILVWLVTARELDCNYAWHAGVDGARAAGISDTLISAIEKGESPTKLSREEKVLINFCYQLLRGNHHVDDITYGTVVNYFGVPAAVQIAALIGYIAMMSLVANAFEIVPLDDVSRPAL